VPNEPKKWIAVLLGIFVPPIAMMYVSQLRWAGIYLLVGLVIGIVGEFYFRETGVAGALQLAYVLTPAQRDGCDVDHSSSARKPQPVAAALPDLLVKRQFFAQQRLIDFVRYQERDRP